MSARWMRRPARREDALAAAAVSLAIGAGVAAVAFYVVRVMLAREPIGGRALLGAPDGRGEGRDDAPR